MKDWPYLQNYPACPIDYWPGTLCWWAQAKSTESAGGTFAIHWSIERRRQHSTVNGTLIEKLTSKNCLLILSLPSCSLPSMCRFLSDLKWQKKASVRDEILVAVAKLFALSTHKIFVSTLFQAVSMWFFYSPHFLSINALVGTSAMPCPSLF